MLQKSDIVGQRLAEVFQTPWTDPKYIVEGIGPAAYCNVMFELDTGLRFQIYGDEVKPWSEQGPLKPVEVYGEVDRKFIGEEIVEVIVSEDELPIQLYLILANGTILAPGYYLDLYGTRNLVCGVDSIHKYAGGPFKTYWEGATWPPAAI